MYAQSDVQVRDNGPNMKHALAALKYFRCNAHAHTHKHKSPSLFLTCSLACSLSLFYPPLTPSLLPSFTPSLPPSSLSLSRAHARARAYAHTLALQQLGLLRLRESVDAGSEQVREGT